MDNYQCYLTARVRNFKSSERDLAGEESFILQVHHRISEMETLIVAPLVMLMKTTLPFSSVPAWSVDLTLAE